jgi:hypothetical protein
MDQVAPQQFVGFPQVCKQLPIDALLGNDGIARFAPQAPRMHRGCADWQQSGDLPEIVNGFKRTLERTVCGHPIILETLTQTNRRVAHNNEEWNRILIPHLPLTSQSGSR